MSKVKTYTEAQLKKIIADHQKWLDTRFTEKPKGKRAEFPYGANLESANLYGANLESANLESANLYGANLESANLYGADLRSANLESANLESANLYGANLESANLESANLYGANLESANLESANLYGANLRSANLRSADLRSANLESANLESANLYGANLESANLESANLYGANLRSAKTNEQTVLFPQCTLPEEGSFIGWKKVRDGVVLKLEIVGKRVSSYIGRKCRTDEAKVLAAFAPGGQEITDKQVYTSIHRSEFKYEVGKTIKPDIYDADPNVECTGGIHFLMTRKEAEAYV
jgi:uncharacterized protein YjbI with pentapeptide repeats